MLLFKRPSLRSPTTHHSPTFFSVEAFGPRGTDRLKMFGIVLSLVLFNNHDRQIIFFKKASSSRIKPVVVPCILASSHTEGVPLSHALYHKTQ